MASVSVKRREIGQQVDNTHGVDLHEDLSPRYDWIRIMRRARFGSRSKTREIGLILASYGNTDGTRCYAGLRRLAAASECDEKTVRRSLDKLRSLGLITLVESGSHNGRPRKDKQPRNDKYILTVPPDIEDRIPMLPEGELDPEREMELQEERRVDAARRREKRRIEREAAKGSSKGSAEGSANPREDSAKPSAEPGYQGTVAAYQWTVRPVSVDSSAGISGQLTPGKRGVTSEDDAHQIVRPVSNDQENSDHPASLKRASAGAPADIEDVQNDREPNHDAALDAAFEEIAAEFNHDVTRAEADRIRSSLAKGDPVPGIIYAVRFVRRMQARGKAA